MPRLPRLQVGGAVYHVFTRAARDGLLYRDEIDFQIFLLQIGRVVKQLRWICRGYCLMPNHYHLLVETPEPDLAAGMHRINGQYAITFNRRHGACGHLFQSRYGSVLVQTESHFLEEHRYLALNPVRAGLCRRPEDWPWSSYGAMFGPFAAPPFFHTEDALVGFDDGPGDPRLELQAFVEAGLASDILAAA
jgi:putative transposase